ELERRVAPPPRLARGLAAQLRRDLLDERPAPVQEQTTGRPLRRPLELREDLALGVRPDPGHLTQPPAERGFSKRLDARHLERVPDREHPLRREAEQAAEPDE